MELIKKTKDEVHIKQDGKIFKYFVLGTGVIPIHKHEYRNFSVEDEHRRYIKNNLIKS